MNTHGLNRKFIEEKICKNSIFLTKYHQIKSDEQKNITQYYTMTNKNHRLEKLNSPKNMNCEIICLLKRNKFAMSYFRFESIPLYNLTQKKYLIENLNGIKMPVSVPKRETVWRIQQNIQHRLFCNYFNMIPRNEHLNLLFELEKKPPRYERLFGGIIENICEPSATKINDCKQRTLEKNEPLIIITLTCKNSINSKNKNKLIKHGLSISMIALFILFR